MDKVLRLQAQDSEDLVRIVWTYPLNIEEIQFQDHKDSGAQQGRSW
jgi:hypothetical protein